MDFLNEAQNVRSVKGSDRVLRCRSTGEEYPIGQIATALAQKFELERRSVILKLNAAVRDGKQAFGLQWDLASGTPYQPRKARGPRASKGEVKKKKAA